MTYYQKTLIEQTTAAIQALETAIHAAVQAPISDLNARDSIEELLDIRTDLFNLRTDRGES